MQSLKEPAYKIAASEKKPMSGSDRVLRNINQLPEKTSQSSPLNTYQKHQKHIKNTVWASSVPAFPWIKTKSATAWQY